MYRWGKKYNCMRRLYVDTNRREAEGVNLNGGWGERGDVGGSLANPNNSPDLVNPESLPASRALYSKLAL